MLTPILLSVFLAWVILFLPVLFIYRPPKDIDSIYGYRSMRSMSSDELWYYANSYWPKLLLKLSILTLFFQLVLLVFFGFIVSILGATAIWVFFLLVSIMLTEMKLKEVKKCKE
ncbi:SdpI family protein [Arenibacter certesii]|uniref:SdpI family protein n=1 Tax=Arenibacter certesii TaxID=228955 RepID=UPI00047EB228